MITDYLLLTSGDILCTRQEIRQYVEQQYRDREPCPRCGCYLIPTRETARVLFRVYRCANSICAASGRAFRWWPRGWSRRAA